MDGHATAPEFTVRGFRTRVAHDSPGSGGRTRAGGRMSRVVASLTSQDRLRSVVIPLLARFNPGDVTIKHHWTGDPLRLHSFHHKGYWFHGRSREADTLELLSRLLGPGDRVVEVGAHIGYFTILFSRLVGPGGQVTVFEPGENNLTYLRDNTRALGQCGHSRGSSRQHRRHGRLLPGVHLRSEQLPDRGLRRAGVNCRRCSRWTRESGWCKCPSRHSRPWPVISGSVDLVKIDIEGAELDALQGQRRVDRSAAAQC